jgi:8-oxo-dGTP pyrophosphatase MutT (NUDIX family)
MAKRKPQGVVRAAGILLMTRGSCPKFLLMRHTDRWDLPKGHCEDDESFADAALRETWEETGIKPAMIELDPSFQFDVTYGVRYKRWGDEVFTKTVRYFLGRLNKTPKLALTEHESAEWFLWDPPHQIQTQTIDPLLAAVAEHLQSSG